MTHNGSRIARELRRFSHQLTNLRRYGSLTPFTRMRRRHKPQAILERPELELESPLEFLAQTVASACGEFKFVLIGAFDGVLYDTLPRLAIENNWTGILVEPQPNAFAKLQSACADHTCFTLENIAIGLSSGTLDFYTTISGASNLASFDRNHLLRFGIAPHNIQTIAVPVETLGGLLDRHGYERLQLLQIDTEGYDGQILRSIDFTRIQPTIIRYEHLNMVERERSDLIRWLANYGYRFLLEDNDTIAYRSPATDGT